MPQINVTVDDVSPLITYGPSGAWQGAESPFYLDSTYTIADVSAATASFSFYGSAIWIFAAKGTTSPVYNVTLDGATSSFNGIVDSPVYQTPIFNATDLTLGNHHVTLTNAPVTGNGSDPLLTLDYIVWQTEIGQASDTIKHAVIEDTDPAFDYQPENAWYSINNPNESYQYVQNSSHIHQKETVTDWCSQGEHIELFGFVGPEWSNYSVQLDNGDPIVRSAYRDASSEPALLFFATNLAAGNHSLKIANVPTDVPINSHSTSIDYANVSWTVSRLVARPFTVAFRSLIPG
ncbi:hypothetical protein BD410DRAFT_728761 [Rickenella mellea]|uniref:Uncharacterized protein n=1 Tax=Rickenella mellea TaxID=50990 RepID=A0A4Y7PUR1_9AGAM|nr:hypothetical protein BD410DRAFT_728761 [Rickenella mellea]